jgi:synaptobrevin family protein YKT6
MHILQKRPEKPIILKNAFKLDFVAYMKRMFAKQPLIFAARTCVSKIKIKETIKVELTEIDNAFLFAHINQDGIASVIITDHEYPESAAKKVLLEMMREFTKLYDIELINQYKTDQEMKFEILDKMIEKYQDPKEADKLMKIESELDEIQGMLTKTMADLLDRGEKLDDLMKQSDDISNMAYNFYDQSKKANQKCCSIY